MTVIIETQHDRPKKGISEMKVKGNPRIGRKPGT
jgi:hypothetical protein